MFVDIPVTMYSNFFYNKFIKYEHPDVQNYFNRFKNENIGFQGAYPEGVDNIVHPLFAKQVEEDSWGFVKIKKRTSYLNRNRRLNGVVFDDWIFREENEPARDFMNRMNKVRSTKRIKLYGTADTVEQVFSRFKFLDEIKDRFFFIGLNYIDKKPGNRGGFRQEKNGPYIGSKEMKHEYFDEEGPEFEYLIQYHIHEVEFNPSTPIIKLTDFNISVNEDTERHTHYTIFDKNNELLCYAWREVKEQPNILTIGYGNDVLFTIDRTDENFLTNLNDKLLSEINNESI